jgi:hypothetical protein
MGMQNMRVVFRLLGLFVLVWAGTAHAAQLDSSVLEKMVADMDAAIAKRDVDKLGSYLAPAVRITVTASQGKKKATATMNKADYLRAAKESFTGTTDYKYVRLETRIDVSPDKKSAGIHLKTKESAKIQGRESASTSTSNAKVELIQGAPMIVSIDAVSIFELVEAGQK